MSVLILYSLQRLNIYSSKLNQLLHKTFDGERPILEGNDLRCVMGISGQGLITTCGQLWICSEVHYLRSFERSDV